MTAYNKQLALYKDNYLRSQTFSLEDSWPLIQSITAFLCARAKVVAPSVKLGLNEPLRILISTRVENEQETLAQGTNVSSQRLRNSVG